MGRAVGSIHRGSVADRTIDLLRVDGGWLTCEGIALDLGESPQTVSRTLFRLRLRDWVLSRPRDSRLEWRAA